MDRDREKKEREKGKKEIYVSVVNKKCELSIHESENFMYSFFFSFISF